MRAKQLHWAARLLAILAITATLVAAPRNANTATLDVSVTPSLGSTGYVVFFADITVGGNTTGFWYKSPLITTQSPPLLNYTDETAGKITLSDAKFFLSNTQIPLDQLNLTNLPPTDSRFSSLPSSYDPTLSPTPLSSTWFLLLSGFVGLALFAYRGTKKNVAAGATT